MATSVAAITRRPAAWAQYDLTPRAAVLMGCLGLGAAIAADLIDGQLGMIFSIGFVLAVVTTALAVEQYGLYIAGVAPFVLFVTSLFAVAIVNRDAIVVAGLASDVGVFGTTLAVVIDRGITLLVGCGLAIAVVVTRMVAAQRDNTW